MYLYLYTLGIEDPTNPLISPIFADDFSYFPPMYLTVSDNETFLDSEIIMYNKLTADNVEATLEIGHDLMHVWTVYCYSAPESEATIQRIGKFIKSKLD